MKLTKLENNLFLSALESGEVERAILKNIIDRREEFYKEVFTMILGREPDIDKDKGKFTLTKYAFDPPGHFGIHFEGRQIGTVAEYHENNSVNFMFVPTPEK